MTPAGPTGDSSRLIPSVSSPTALLDAAGASLDRLVRVQQDFPQPGVLFRDLTPVLADAGALRDVARALAAAAPDATLIAGLESRGFLLGAAAAMVAEIGVLAIRKPGKLPVPCSVRTTRWNTEPPGWNCIPTTYPATRGCW